MTKDEFKIMYRKLLVECQLSESELARQLGTSSQGLGKKINAGSMRFLEFINILDYLGYEFKIDKKK